MDKNGFYGSGSIIMLRLARCNTVIPLTQRTIFGLFLKEFASDNFKLDESGRKFCHRVKHTVEEEEIARYEQFHLFLLRFQKTCTADT